MFFYFFLFVSYTHNIQTCANQFNGQCNLKSFEILAASRKILLTDVSLTNIRTVDREYTVNWMLQTNWERCQHDFQTDFMLSSMTSCTQYLPNVYQPFFDWSWFWNHKWNSVTKVKCFQPNLNEGKIKWEKMKKIISNNNNDSK